MISAAWGIAAKNPTVSFVGIIFYPVFYEQCFVVQNVVDEQDVGAQGGVQLLRPEPVVVAVRGVIADDLTRFFWKQNLES